MYNYSCKLRKGENPTSREKNSHVQEQLPPDAAVFFTPTEKLAAVSLLTGFISQSAVRSTFTPLMLPLVHCRDDFTAREREHRNHGNLGEVDT